MLTIRIIVDMLPIVCWPSLKITFNKVDLDFVISHCHIYNDTLVIFGLAQFHQDILQLTITKINEVIFASFLIKMQCSLLQSTFPTNNQLMSMSSFKKRASLTTNTKWKESHILTILTTSITNTTTKIL